MEFSFASHKEKSPSTNVGTLNGLVPCSRELEFEGLVDQPLYDVLGTDFIVSF